MELNIDTGVEEFRVNGRGVLRFNPADPNLYHRFFAAGAELDGYDAALTKALAALDGDEQQRAAAGLALLNEYDGKIKKLLTGIFGAENDFDAILGGVNLAGVGANGKRVVQNLLEALTPILREVVDTAGDDSDNPTRASTIAGLLSELLETHAAKCDDGGAREEDRPPHVISEVHGTSANIDSIASCDIETGTQIYLVLDDGAAFRIAVEAVA